MTNLPTKLIIDGKSLLTINDIHDCIKKGLNFPDYYGMNADALWDCLVDCILSDDFIIVDWFDFRLSQNRLGNEVQILKTIFLDAHHQYSKNITVTIHD